MRHLVAFGVSQQRLAPRALHARQLGLVGIVANLCPVHDIRLAAALNARHEPFAIIAVVQQRLNAGVTRERWVAGLDADGVGVFRAAPIEDRENVSFIGFGAFVGVDFIGNQQVAFGAAQFAGCVRAKKVQAAAWEAFEGDRVR